MSNDSQTEESTYEGDTDHDDYRHESKNSKINFPNEDKSELSYKNNNYAENCKTHSTSEIDFLEEQIRVERLKIELHELRLKSKSIEDFEAEEKYPKNSLIALRESVKFPNLSITRDQYSKKEERKIVFDLAKNGSKVPKYDGKGSLIEFLCKRIYFFTVDHGITETKDLLPWIHHCFTNFDCRERLQRHLNEIFPKTDSHDVKELLRLLGTRLSRVKEKIDPAIDKRRPHEAVEDAVFRLLDKANRASESENVSMNLIKETLVDHESDPRIALEINRCLFKKELSPILFRNCAEMVDSMMKLGELKLVQDEHDQGSEIYAFDDTHENLCNSCKKPQPRKDHSGNYFKTCFACSQNETRRNLGTRSEPKTRNCRDCNRPHSEKSNLTGRIFPFCSDCYNNFHERKSDIGSSRRN